MLLNQFQPIPRFSFFSQDLRHINTIAIRSNRTGVILLGGGVMKHHINNANLMRNGSDYTVYVNTGQVFQIFILFCNFQLKFEKM